jgi:Mrp family chromosome partitioning ATPase
MKSDLLYSSEYTFPFLTLNLFSERFSDDDIDANISILSEITEFDVKELRHATNRPLLNTQYFKSIEDIPPTIGDISDSWLALTADNYTKKFREIKKGPDIGKTRAIHFYGYKGGQARTTTLAIAAKRLADQGLRVLAIDADIEAPSLHVLFNTAIPHLSSSLMGLCERDGEINPITAYSGEDGGFVEIIGCRPTSSDFDMDFMAFALNTALDSNVLRGAFERLRNYNSRHPRWDIVLIDHRTGIAPSVIPTMQAWPGSVVMSLRPDNLSLPAKQIAKIIFSLYPPFPGAFVSFSIDPEERKDKKNIREIKVREVFLGVLAEAVEAGAESTEQIDTEILEGNFISWYFDRAMLESDLPDYSRLSKDNQDSISDLIQVLGIDNLKHQLQSQATETEQAKQQPRTPSGATDTGWFIETKEVATLMQSSSAISYVFGRKGTGKTRIYREMHVRKVGVPLFAAADYKHGGLQSQSIASNDLVKQCDGNYEMFWWGLLTSALEVNSDPLSIENNLRNKIQKNYFSNPSLEWGPILVCLIKDISTPITFLIDGVETAVISKDTKQFVEALFRFLSTIQNDSRLCDKIGFKLFIRPDLSVGIQNIEQQVAGRKSELRWGEAAIFNYMLSEIERSSWYNENFATACTEISKHKEYIKEAKLERDQYEMIMLQIFPLKIRRNNLLTMTFLRTYFSDSVSEFDKRSSFYPRVIGSFLEHIATICSSSPEEALDSGQKISHTVILEAFEYATKEFISEIKQELYFALNLASTQEENIKLVDELILSLQGMQTPFSLDECIDKLQEKTSSKELEIKSLRDAMRQMKDMGIFEIHPIDALKWRVGRLFKEALRMKYVR